MLEDRIELKRLKCGWINLFTVLFLILVISDHSDADSVKQTIESRRLVPASLIEWNSGPDHAVLVDKSKQKVMVFERGNLFEPYRVYNCSTGEKQLRGSISSQEFIWTKIWLPYTEPGLCP